MYTFVLKQLRISLVLLLLMTILTGIIYPGIVTAIAHLCFPWQANGSLLMKDNKPIGSALIGQSFNSPQYFWGRPSATTPFPYNAASSAASNLGPSNPDLLTAVKQRIADLHQADPQQHNLVPLDLVTASGSGLDPEISPLAALYQVSRVAKARHLSEVQVEALVNQHIQSRTLGFLGEPRVNVLELNLALDKA